MRMKHNEMLPVGSFKGICVGLPVKILFQLAMTTSTLGSMKFTQNAILGYHTYQKERKWNMFEKGQARVSAKRKEKVLGQICATTKN